MALTLAGGTTAYATVTDVTNRCDVRTLGDYLGDAGARLTSAQVTSSTVLSALLMEASGEFESRMMRGQRYQVVDINAMVTQAGNGKELIAGIVAGWALLLVWQRRPMRFAADEMPLHARLAGEKMEALSNGDAILPFLEAEQAGLEAHRTDGESEVMARNGAATIARRFFGVRGRDYDPQF